MATLSDTAPATIGAPAEAPLLLCVEDEAAFREMMARELEHAGYRVLTARNIVEALEHFRNERDAISLIIADFRLPGGTALDLFAQMRALGPVPRVLICTGLLFPRMRDDLAAAGLTRYLFKPFRIPELLDTVQRHLRD